MIGCVLKEMRKCGRLAYCCSYYGSCNKRNMEDGKIFDAALELLHFCFL
jgi:hypothetical protein